VIRAEIHVTLKPGVLDPQGATLRRSMESLGFGSVADVRFGKLIQVTFQGTEPEAVRPQVERMCREVLSNPVIEAYSFQLFADK
jgi:phosphoribosylformylglycinamidine synthase